MSRTGAQIRASENQSKFVQERVTQVEKHFGDLCTNFAAYNRKLSKVRDKGDEVARSVMAYSEHETLNHTTKTALRDFAEHFSGVQDYREAEVRRIEARVVEPLTLYGTACKHAKERLKAAFNARDKEMKQKRNLDKVKTRAPSDRHQIAETNLQKASVDASMTSKALEKEIDGFEGKKLQDIKKILLDFVNVELMYHAKALEMYTNCHHSLTTMSEEDDLEEFRNSLRPSTAQSRMAMHLSGSKNSLNAGSVGHRTPSATPQGARRTPHHSHMTNGEGMSTLNTTGTHSMYSDTYQDDDDDDEYETDEDETEYGQEPQRGQPQAQPRR